MVSVKKANEGPSAGFLLFHGNNESGFRGVESVDVLMT